MGSRFWTFTLNNYTEEDEAQLLKFSETELCRYLVYGREVAPTTLTPHLQGFVALKRQYRLLGLKKLIGCSLNLDKRYEKSTNEQAAAYCKKEQDFVEFGSLSTQGERSDLKKACDMIKQGGALRDVFEEYPDTFVRNYRGLGIAKALITEPFTPPDVRGEWYVGAPGTGKSRKAREDNPGAYLKQQNKWWDGYTSEKVVIWDDLDKGAIGLGHLLKLWSDRYSVEAEIKGGTVKLQHHTLIVTSNYCIEELWGDDPEMCLAIQRRFKLMEFPDQVYAKHPIQNQYVNGFQPNF